MASRNLRKRPFVNGLLILLLASAALAQVKTSSPATSEAPAPSDGRHEDVKIHGHWTVIVRNADGSTSSHHEFENALVNTGGIGLAQLLAHLANTPSWLVDLTFSGGNPGERLLIVNSPSASQNNPEILPILNVSVPPSGVNAGMLVLSATVPGTTSLTYAGKPVNLGGQLTTVSTALIGNANSGVLWGNNGGNMVTFSFRDLTKAVPPDTTAPSPINLQTGQSLDVTVVLSFK